MTANPRATAWCCAGELHAELPPLTQVLCCGVAATSSLNPLITIRAHKSSNLHSRWPSRLSDRKLGAGYRSDEHWKPETSAYGPECADSKINSCMETCASQDRKSRQSRSTRMAPSGHFRSTCAGVGFEIPGIWSPNGCGATYIQKEHLSGSYQAFGNL